MLVYGLTSRNNNTDIYFSVKMKDKHRLDMEFYENQKKEMEAFRNIDIEEYKKNLPKPFELWDMDDIHIPLGITKKIWWEQYFHGRFADKKILDVGCGNAYHVPYFALNDNYVTCLDSSKESLSILQDILDKLNLKADMKLGFIEDTVLNEEFDVVNFSNMLHHTTDIKKSLDNARKMLKEFGYLIVCEPIYNFPFRYIVETNFLKNLNPLKRYFIKKNLYYMEEISYPKDTYIQAVEEAGFKILHISYDTNFFGYALGLIGVKNRSIRKVVFKFDKFFTLFIPNYFKSFVYIIAQKPKGE